MHVSPRLRGGALIGAALLAVGLAVPAPALAAEAPVVKNDPIRLETGHIDAFNLILNDDDTPRLVLKEDVTGSHVLREPESVELYVKEQARTEFPAEFLPGLSGEAYFLPLTQDHNLIWPGWDTQGVVSAFPGADTDIVVSAIDGPGQVFLWSSGSFGEKKSLLKDGSWELPDTISQPYPAHTHANWAFTEPGTYKLTVRADVRSADGTKTASTGTQTYTFVVGEQASVEQLLTIEPLADHYHSNSPIDLEATADPAVDDGTYRWYLQRTDQDAPALIEGATGAKHRITAEQALNGAKVTAELLGEDGNVAATAGAVTIEVDDHGAAPLQKVTIGGVADHYHTGDTATLTASVDPASVLTRYEWYVQKKGDAAAVLVEGENGAEYSFEVTAELAGAAVSARLTYDNGESYAESAPVLVELDDHGAVPATELTIGSDRDVDDYWVGQTATLNAKQSVPTGLTEYRWLTKAPGAAEFTAVDGQTAAEYKFKPTLANSGVQVKVELLHDGEVHAASDAVTITAQQRPVVTELTVTADKESYAPGDTAQLTSAQNPQTDHAHYHWYVKRAGAADFVWVDQSRDKDLAYPVTAEDDGAQLVLRLFDDTHAVIAESAPHTLNVTPVEQPEPVTELSIDGLADGYHVGQIAELVAVQNPATDEDHYHWFIKRDGDADFSVIAGALAATLEHEVADGDAGAQIVAKLYNHDHALIAESEAVTLQVLPGAPKPSDAPQTQTEDVLDDVDAGGIEVSDTTPVAGDTITVTVGSERAGEWIAAWLFSDPALLGGDWIQVADDGTIRVTIPADTTAGAHRLAAFNAAGELIGWEQLQVSAASGAGGNGAGGNGAGGNGAGGDLAVTGGEFAGAVLGGGILLLLIGAGVLIAARRRPVAAPESRQ